MSENDGPRGLNISTYWDRKDFAREMEWDTGSITMLPVDRFPPNPLGIHSMSDNGSEWVKDWYDPEYYKNSPVNDPQGPEAPKHKNSLGQYTKVMRGQGFPDSVSNLGGNVHRRPQSPDGDFSGNGHKQIYSTTARCVVNHKEPVN
jgi:formylglycine-generating enzyme required for sulfatase activity